MRHVAAIAGIAALSAAIHLLPTALVAMLCVASVAVATSVHSVWSKYHDQG